MRRITFLVLCLVFAGCAKVETASSGNNPSEMITVSPTVETQVLLKPVAPSVKLSVKQQKYLDESLPPKVRETLEKAERFELLGETGVDTGEWRTFEPNRILKVTDDSTKSRILEAFYHDASREDSPAICYYPRHLIKATYQGKTVEIEICFSCSRYFVSSEFGKFEGTLVRENRKSENFLKQILESKGVEIKQ